MRKIWMFEKIDRQNLIPINMTQTKGKNDKSLPQHLF